MKKIALFVFLLLFSGMPIVWAQHHAPMKEGSINEVLPYVEKADGIKPSTPKSSMPLKFWYYDPYLSQKECLTRTEAVSRKIPVDSAQKTCTDPTPPR